MKTPVEDDRIEIPIMVNGKVKSRIVIPADYAETDVEAEALKDPKVAEFLRGKIIRHKKYVPKKIYTIATS